MQNDDLLDQLINKIGQKLQDRLDRLENEKEESGEITLGESGEDKILKALARYLSMDMKLYCEITEDSNEKVCSIEYDLTLNGKIISSS